MVGDLIAGRRAGLFADLLAYEKKAERIDGIIHYSEPSTPEFTQPTLAWSECTRATATSERSTARRSSCG